MFEWYILDDQHNPVPCTGTGVEQVEQYTEWVKTHTRVVRQDVVREKSEVFNTTEIEVSTVFLGLDHNLWDEDRKPLLFETLIFGGVNDGKGTRYHTWDEALAGHAKYMELALKEVEV